MTVSKAQLRAQAKYDKDNTVQIKLKLNKKTDKDIIDWLNEETVDITRGQEYAAYIFNAVFGDNPIFKFNGNVRNFGLIDNLPKEACVEVPCLVDGSGIRGCHVGKLPVQCAALNMQNINCQLLTIEAATTGKIETLYQAAMMDPHLQSELSIDDIVAMCDDLIEAHGDWLPKFN